MRNVQEWCFSMKVPQTNCHAKNYETYQQVVLFNFFFLSTGNSYNCDDNHNCCVGCGPQEQFYGCADISISASSGNPHPNTLNSHPVVQQGGVVGFRPILSGPGHVTASCEATPMFKARYQYADRYCIAQCQQNKCPSSAYCTDACRNK